MYDSLSGRFDTLRFYTEPFDPSVLSPLEYYLFMNPEVIFDEKPAWSTAAWGCSWYCGAWPDSIYASSTLPPSTMYDYNAVNIHDFDLRTAWVEGSDGDGKYESITIKFAANCPPATTLHIYNGYMRTSKTWHENSRVKTFRMHINEVPYAILELDDLIGCQTFVFDELKEKDTELYIRLEILDIYPGMKYSDVAVSEINFDGTGVHCFAAGTPIASPDGDILIEDLRPGDRIWAYDPATGTVEASAVTGIVSRQHHNLWELTFGETRLTVTDDHPFYHDGRYYSVVPNDKYGVTTSALETGQALSRFENGTVSPVILTGVKKTEGCLPAYAVTGLEKHSLYYAGSLCVTVE